MAEFLFHGAPRVQALLERHFEEANGKPYNCVRDVRQMQELRDLAIALEREHSKSWGGAERRIDARMGDGWTRNLADALDRLESQRARTPIDIAHKAGCPAGEVRNSVCLCGLEPPKPRTET